jgi:hypothetical protein
MKSVADIDHLLREWSNLNECSPKSISVWSKKKYKWHCSNDHLYDATPEKRYVGRGCPYCAGKYATDSKNVAKLFPYLLDEWDFERNAEINPYNLLPRSNKKMWWKCKNGHEWLTTVNNRVIGYGCPYCCGKRTNESTSLFCLFPSLMGEWDYDKNTVDPKKISCKNSRIAWWKCKSGHSWKSAISSRTSGHGCPYCAGQKATPTNNLVMSNPVFLSEWDDAKNLGINPCELMIGSGKKVWWKCKNGHSWLSSINNRKNNCNCPYCLKIELKNGLLFDSYAEAYYFINNLSNVKVKINQQYCKGDRKIGKSRYDFYIECENKYIEVTSYTEFNCRRWSEYIKNINRKKEYVEKILAANFSFIQIEVTNDIKKVVDGARKY